jgi:soluble lytic murein transglycosylase
MLLIGKTALARGLDLDWYAFPDIGMPAYKRVGPPLDRSIVYSVVRTESSFNPQDLSPAKAVGLMQVTRRRAATPPSGSAPPSTGSAW